MSLPTAYEVEGFFYFMSFYFFSVVSVHFDYPLCFIDSFKTKFMIQKKRIFMNTYFATGVFFIFLIFAAKT